MGESINGLYANSTLITYGNTSEDYDLDPNATATGFFYEHNDAPYLVTNQHVVLDENGEPLDAIDIHITPSHKIDENDLYTIDLLESDSKRWDAHAEADIAVIPLDLNLDEIGNGAYTSNDILPRNAALNGRIASGGDAAIVVGFPLGFTGTNKLPLIRNALISTPYGVSFDDEPCFLTDAQMHPGMSGSPVLTDTKHTSVNYSEDSLDPDTEPVVESRVGGLTKRYLLGVHSEEVAPVIDRDPDLEELREMVDDDLEEVIDRVEYLELAYNSKIGLNKVWYADIIHHILTE